MFTTERLLWLLVVAGVVAIFYASGDGRYRYPCQDPNNWSKAECQPPICTATKQCPEDLLGEPNE